MIKQWIACAGSVLMIASAAALGWACADEEPDAPEPSPTSSTPAPTATVAVTYAPPGPTTFRVIGGRNDGAIDFESFMPADIHIREGDSIEWTSRGYEGHTVTFATQEQLAAIMSGYLQPDPADPEQKIFNPEFALPRGSRTVDGSGAYVNSGFIGVPAEGTYTLTFAKRGVYQYLCVVHPLWMRGTVSVDAPDAQVESPETVSARGAEEMERYREAATRAVDEAASQRRTVPGPEGTNVHHVAVGVVTPYGQIATYIPAGLTIKAGDTVIFENDERNFHNVVFKGSLAEPPPAYDVYVDPATGGINVALAKESAMAVDPPAGGFDDQTFLSSGSMGVAMPRSRWQVTFDKPGRYAYNCTIHAFAGMAGVIDVQPR